MGVFYCTHCAMPLPIRHHRVAMPTGAPWWHCSTNSIVAYYTLLTHACEIHVYHILYVLIVAVATPSIVVYDRHLKYFSCNKVLVPCDMHAIWARRSGKTRVIFGT